MTIRRRSPAEIDAAIRVSVGMKFLNREHGRSFSLNIFRENATELIEALQHLSDPEYGLNLMAVDNKEAGTQAHREVNRRIHNFVAAAKTLVDHTRVFISEHYSQTDLSEICKKEVKDRFDSNKTAKFVHDLRNYMLHRGLPNSEMFIHFSQDPEQPSKNSKLQTGVRLSADQLMDWKGWTAPARAYLETVGEYVSIETFVRTYAAQIEEFQKWFSERLYEFHTADLAELENLREEYALSEEQTETFATANAPDQPDNFTLFDINAEGILIPPQTAEKIKDLSDKLLSSITKIELASRLQKEFQSERPTSAIITPDKFIEQPVFFLEDANGNRVLVFIQKDDDVYGFDYKALGILDDMIMLFSNIPWAKKALSNKFIQSEIIKWCRSSFEFTDVLPLAESLISECRSKVRLYSVWVPIAHLEIEDEFSFGLAQISPITADMIGRLEANGLELAPNQENEVKGMFENLRKKMQGFAAVVVNSVSVQERAGKEGLTIANEVVNLLRFFSPAASDSSLYCPTSLLGSEIVPTNNVLVLGDNSFSYSEANATTGVAYWQMSKIRISELKQAFDAAGALVNVENLDEFERSVRSGMILFGTAATFRQLIDRLIYTISSMESILIKHDLEVRAFSVERRMARLLAANEEQAAEIGAVVRAAYRRRARHGSFDWSDIDKEFLGEFVRCAHRVLVIALQNIPNFGSRSDFIEAVEERSCA
jgi:hypothetical protein